MLYKIKNAHKLTVEDLRGIAFFNRIILNYEKMLKIEKRHADTTTDTDTKKGS